VPVSFEEENKGAPLARQDQGMGDIFVLAHNIKVEYFSSELDEVFCMGSSPYILIFLIIISSHMRTK
jgi:hypothetical protein